MQPLNQSQTKALLQTLGIFPSKKLGQNFLVDGNIVRKSLELAEVKAGENVVEVGPGLGTLTRGLLAGGANVYAVEYDHRLAAYLRGGFLEEAGESASRLHLCEADAVDKPLGEMPESVERYKIVANLPYAISTPWLEKILAGPLPERMVLMLQREAAERYLAQPGSKNYGAISIFLHAAYETGQGHSVSRQCFYPAPDIDSQLFHVKRREQPKRFSEPIRQAIRRVFTHRRKQIGGLCTKEPLLTEWCARLPEYGHSSSDRPEAIRQSAWEALAE